MEVNLEMGPEFLMYLHCKPVRVEWGIELIGMNTDNETMIFVFMAAN